MYIDCYSTCGVANNKCRNKYCSANPKYVAPTPRVKEKQGPGKPTHSKRASIPKYEYSMMGLFSKV